MSSRGLVSHENEASSPVNQIELAKKLKMSRMRSMTISHKSSSNRLPARIDIADVDSESDSDSDSDFDNQILPGDNPKLIDVQNPDKI